MIKIFLDANILFTAAHNPKGKAAFLINASKEGHWVVVASTLAVEEARRNLDRKFPSCLPEFNTLLEKVQIVPSVGGSRCPISLPEKDKLIFEAALYCQATHLLTGDLHDFGPYMNKKEYGILIQTVSDFLASI